MLSHSQSCQPSCRASSQVAAGKVEGSEAHGLDDTCRMQGGQSALCHLIRDWSVPPSCVTIPASCPARAFGRPRTMPHGARLASAKHVCPCRPPRERPASHRVYVYNMTMAHGPAVKLAHRPTELCHSPQRCAVTGRRPHHKEAWLAADARRALQSHYASTPRRTHAFGGPCSHKERVGVTQGNPMKM